MPNRFDIFITRLETKHAREGAPSHPIGDQHGARRDKADAKPIRPERRSRRKTAPNAVTSTTLSLSSEAT